MRRHHCCSSDNKFFCYRYLLPERGKGGKQKTGVCRKTVCPKWEHTMAWDDISLEALWDRSLELTVWDHDRLGHNEILGGVRFNLGKGTKKFQAFLKLCGFQKAFLYKRISDSTRILK